MYKSINTIMGDKIDNILEASVATLLGIVMVCAMVIPVGVQQISSLVGTNMTQWNSLLYLVITMCVVGLMIGVIRYFTSSSKR